MSVVFYKTAVILHRNPHSFVVTISVFPGNFLFFRGRAKPWIKKRNGSVPRNNDNRCEKLFLFPRLLRRCSIKSQDLIVWRIGFTGKVSLGFQIVSLVEKVDREHDGNCQTHISSCGQFSFPNDAVEKALFWLIGCVSYFPSVCSISYWMRG